MGMTQRFKIVADSYRHTPDHTLPDMAPFGAHRQRPAACHVGVVGQDVIRSAVYAEYFASALQHPRIPYFLEACVGLPPR